MPRNAAQKLIEPHLVEGMPEPGREIGLTIDQTLTQDATGTLVMLEFEAMGLPRVRTELSAQYVDHNLLQEDYRNPDDHVFLHSAARRFGLHFSPPGNGVSHPVHMECFGRPGKTLLGSDSHTCAAGSLGMLAIGAGGLEVAMAMAGEPFHVKMPRVRGIRLSGELPDWVSAKDVILEVLRRYGVDGGKGWILEYFGPGVAGLSAMDRHVIANMGMETGATATVFPSDERTREFLESQGRSDDWEPLAADGGAVYDDTVEIDLSRLEPLIALPGSPGNVVPVREVAGRPVFQSYIGSSANPGLRDFGIAGHMVAGRRIADGVSFDVNPTSRRVLDGMVQDGTLARLIEAGARLHQTGCNGCIGMGQAPATGRNSLRTVPRNFPGRSGTPEDSVYLCSPETATAAALTGEIIDPRHLGIAYPRFDEQPAVDPAIGVPTPPPADGSDVALDKGPNIADLPDFAPVADRLAGPVLLKTGDDVSTDEIMPAGARVLPLRSNIPEISKFTFSRLDEGYYERAIAHQARGSFVVGGDNYGQGSSREHAAIAPAYLGVKAVFAKSFARIHWQNLVNFGVVPLEFLDAADGERIAEGDELVVEDLHQGLRDGRIKVQNRTRGASLTVGHSLSERQLEVLLAGGLINWVRARRAA
ncbi:aconitate hydratase [Sediminicurvatus halobius]|uniref:Aconitate hydratase n=1 Tax=Sediminicurvatus halobius TaxID=2182432 RepID=A0A2U2N9K4_9GAMM|nr:aconitate hydratase [Spiribacter halobius]PWG65871.1 aconitate hydratase [Spiribacter halobius]UEX77919.1 aconitate hydratase [Spiribacter halobius]